MARLFRLSDEARARGEPHLPHGRARRSLPPRGAGGGPPGNLGMAFRCVGARNAEPDRHRTGPAANEQASRPRNPEAAVNGRLSGAIDQWPSASRFRRWGAGGEFQFSKAEC